MTLSLNINKVCVCLSYHIFAADLTELMTETVEIKNQFLFNYLRHQHEVREILNGTTKDHMVS